MSAAARTADATAAGAALLALHSMTPARLRGLLHRWPDPLAAAEHVADGHAATVTGTGEALVSAELARRWAQELDVDAVAPTVRRRGTCLLRAGTPGWPLRDDPPDRPALLLAEGRATHAFDAPRVAVVGTRAATPHGLADARAIGEHLARCGVTVISGMAIGIDAAAHEGALAAGGVAVGVLATGLDVVYPRRHRRLFQAVRGAGLLVTEHGFGVGPLPYRFPVRNRIIAAVADVVVVVEATVHGGARITAEHALRYGRPVLAVPGSRRNAAAGGTNALLADGAHPLLEPSDVLVALGLTPGAPGGWARLEPRSTELSPDARRVLDAFGGDAATPDQLAARTDLTSPATTTALAELARAGRVMRDRGWWWPR